MQVYMYMVYVGPGAYNVPSQYSFGPAYTIAVRNETFDQKCNANPGKQKHTSKNSKIWVRVISVISIKH